MPFLSPNRQRQCTEGNNQRQKKKLTSISIINPARVALHERRHQLESPHSRSRRAPYLSEHCIPVCSADTRRHLRSANRHLLAVLRFRLNTYGRRAFSVAGPIAWNSLPSGIQQAVLGCLDCFRRLLKTYLVLVRVIL